MMTELQAAGIVACAAITIAALMVALAANRSARHDRTTIDTDHARRLGIELERLHRRLADLEARVTHLPHGTLVHKPHYPPPAPLPPASGAHDAHRARFIDTLTMPESILTGGWRP